MERDLFACDDAEKPSDHFYVRCDIVFVRVVAACPTGKNARPSFNFAGLACVVEPQPAPNSIVSGETTGEREKEIKGGAGWVLLEFIIATKIRVTYAWRVT